MATQSIEKQLSAKLLQQNAANKVTNERTELLAELKKSLEIDCEEFQDEHFDGYLFKKGILSQANLKFDDLMSEIEILRKCNHENIIEV